MCSKELKTLINSPEFVKLYKNKSTVSFLHQGSLYSLFMSDQENNKTTPRHIPIDHLKRVDRDIDWNSYDLLLESSNQRVCVKSASHDFVVYDLITGDSYKGIPDSALKEDWCGWLGYGFGHDPYADDYKIVLLVSSPDGDDYYDIHQCNLGFVYCFRNRGWMSFKPRFPNGATYDWGSSYSAAYCFNSALHWVVDKCINNGDGDDDYDNEIYDQAIVALDLHTGRVTEITMPEAYIGKTSPTLAELDGRLCFCDYVTYGEDGDSFRFDVWVMEEYGVEKSWTNLIRIEDDPYLRLPSFEYWRTPPVLYSREGGRKTVVCLCHGSKLLVYEYEVCEGDEVRRSFTQHYLGEGGESMEVRKEIQGHGIWSSLVRLLNLVT